jgi:UPF0148 protein
MARPEPQETLSRSSKDKMKQTVELVRKGAAILGEPCQTCGGVQIRYHGKTYCTSHEDLSAVLQERDVSLDSVVAGLRQLLLSKVSESMSLLEKEHDSAKQDALVTLMTKYYELLQKLPQK